MVLRAAISTSSFAQDDDTPLKKLHVHGVTVVPNPYGRRLSEDEIIAHLDGIDGLIAGLEPLKRRVLSSAKSLKAIARVGIGIANVDMDAAKELGIKVSNTPEGPTDAVAEMTITALLALIRQVIPSNTDMHEGKWKKRIGFGLQGMKVLLIGYGRIGRRVRQLLKAFGAEIMVCDPFIDGSALQDGDQLVDLPSGLAQAEVISLHASGVDPILGKNEFERLQPGAILLNAARAELVDEPALVQALEKGRLAKVWFDVFWEEPYAGELVRYPQVLLTPHVATYTKQCRLSMESAAVENLLCDLGLTKPT